MVGIAVNKVRDSFSDTVDRVAFKGERIILQRHGKDEVALVPLSDLELLEVLEDRDDVAAAMEALAESGEFRDFADVQKELGLVK